MGRTTHDKHVAAAASGVPGGVVYIEHMFWALTPPWLTAVALFLFGGLAHLAWGDPTRVGLISGFLGAVTVLLGVLTAWVSRPRHPVVQHLSINSVVLGGGWIVIATNWGWGHGMWWAYPLFAIPLCAGWNIKRLLRGAGGDNGVIERGGSWEGVRDKVGILRATIHRQDQVGPRVVVKGEIEPGSTLSQVAQDGPALAGLMKAPSDGVTITRDPDHPDDSSRFEASIVPVDVLRKTFAWPGPSHPGTSIADHPIRIGTFRDAEPVELMLPGKRGVKVLSHIMIQAMTGAGKSELLQEICDEVLSRCDTELEYIDTGDKAEQTVGPLLSGLARPPSLTDADAKKHFEELDREIRPRAAHLAARGLREWEKDCGLSFKVVIIDEAGDSIAADKKRFVRLSRKLRSLGVVLVVAQQNFSQRTMPVDARKNFGTGICGGIAEAGDASWVLSDRTIEAGAQPWEWKNFFPGYFYIEDGGIPQHRWPVPWRACLTDPEQVRASIEANAVHRWSGEPLELAPAGAVDDDGDEGFEPRAEGDDPVRDQREVEAASYEPPADMAREMAGVDPDAEMPTEGMDMDRELAPPAGSKLSTVQAVAELDVILAELRDKGRKEFRRGDLVREGAVRRCDRSKSWLSGELGRRVDRRELAYVGDPEDGLYAWADLLAHAE